MLPEEQDLTDLLAKKEQEWKELQQRQILFLQQNLKDTQMNLQEQKEKFERLKKDFTHNLRVLAETERERQQCEMMFTRLRVMENAKQTEISDLKVQIEKLLQELQRERKNYGDLQGHHQRRMKELKIELDQLNSSKNSYIDHHVAEYEKIKRQLERKIEEVQGDLALQKQELSLEFDCEMKKHEHDFRVRLDEMSAVALSHELKVKLVTKELDIVREMELKEVECLQQAESVNQRLQEDLKRKDFEMKDLVAVKEARIKELDGCVQTLQHKLKRKEDNFQLKYEQLDRCAREKESVLNWMKEAHDEQVLELEKQKKELQMCVETLQMEQQRTQCYHQDALAEKDSTIIKLKDDVDRLKTGWDSYITQVSQDTVNKDLHIQSLQEEEEKLKAEIAKLQKDIERYQQQLAGSVERERLFEQSRVQVELDWQKRCEKIEKTQYQKSEELIEGLSKAKDQLEAELKEKDRRVNELQLVVSTMTWERDKAQTREQAAAMTDFVSREIQKLQEQNSELRQVIAQMRKEMETLCVQMSPADPEQTEPSSDNTCETATSANYVKALEEEIKDLKQRYREIEERLQLALSPKDTPDHPSTIKPVLPDNAYIQTHIRSLNETIGALRADKVASAATAKRLEARTAHLESMVAEFTQKVQQKQAEINQLQFQLNNETRHSQTTISSLQVRQSELELQLREAQKEAEEYFKGNLKQNLETVGLGNEVCALKLELASQRAPVVLSESEAVKQLHEEVWTLRQQLAVLTASDDRQSNPNILKSKLKEAMKKISQLNMEKQQLIEIGNRLQAEVVSAEAKAANTLKQAPEPQSRLSRLESLQYQLTQQELQFAQYQKTPGLSAADHSNTVANPQGPSNRSAVQMTEAKPTQKENLLPSHHVTSARSLRSAASPTEGDTSLQEVWKILDMGSSLSLLSSVEQTEQVLPGKSQSGNHRKVPLSQTPQSAKGKSPHKTGRAVTTKPTKGRGTPKVRNYNIRD
ncbi:coiled-coil domain-containing protein 57 [Mantella aurantiaca]